MRNTQLILCNISKTFKVLKIGNKDLRSQIAGQQQSKIILVWEIENSTQKSKYVAKFRPVGLVRGRVERGSWFEPRFIFTYTINFARYQEAPLY